MPAKKLIYPVVCGGGIKRATSSTKLNKMKNRATNTLRNFNLRFVVQKREVFVHRGFFSLTTGQAHSRRRSALRETAKQTRLAAEKREEEEEAKAASNFEKNSL